MNNFIAGFGVTLLIHIQFIFVNQCVMVYNASIIGSILLVCITVATNAQRINNTFTFRSIDQPSYFRFHYDNDYFTKTDEYYSQGIMFEFVHPGLKKFFLSKLLWKPFSTAPQYGLSFNIFGYTPTSIKSDAILYGDRPFNSNLSMQTFLRQVDHVRKQKIAAAFSIGVMGPAALGYEIQYNIHKWTTNPLPHGWQHQIKNDVIVNYQLNYEKQLLATTNYFLLNATAEARAGTLNDKINAGFNLMAGRFNSRYIAPTNKNRKAEYYFYAQGLVNAVAYDASLQGGLFNRSSAYTIAAGDINRITFQADAGIIVNFHKLFLSYTQSFLSREFRTGTYHRWGGVSAGFTL